MEAQKVKAYLLRAWQVDRRIDRLIDERDSIWHRTETLRSPRISDMPRSGRRRDWTDSVDQLVDLCAEIDREIQELCRLKREVRDAIESVEDMRLRRVLELRYRSYLSWEAIAAELGYEVRWVYRLHGRALQAVTIRVESGELGVERRSH